MSNRLDTITEKDVSNLSSLFYERVKRSGNNTAYLNYDFQLSKWCERSWNDIAAKVEVWKSALSGENLAKGDRIAIMMKNSPEWVVFDQAALSLGLVIVPLYINDRVENIINILKDSNVKLFFLDNDDVYSSLLDSRSELPELNHIITTENIFNVTENKISKLNSWLTDAKETVKSCKIKQDDLVSIVYTSGTTGKPKGVMLSHRNILSNAMAAVRCEEFYVDDIYLSFLPLSHMFERTVGYYMPVIAGSTVAYARSIESLAEDLLVIKPTILVTVPRIFERVYNKIKLQLSNKSYLARFIFNMAVSVGWTRFQYTQRKTNWTPIIILFPLLHKLVASKILAKLGGRLRLAISGGAPLSNEIARTFIGLGVTISQGYGLTEASPIISTNLLHDNNPYSVGQPFDNLEIKISEEDELLIKGPSVMLGYWKNEAATKLAIDNAGWLHTGDKAKIENDHIFITGRLKDILVLSNGEKISPTDLELAILNDSLFEQVIVLGEGRPYLSALVSFNEAEWIKLAGSLAIEANEINKNNKLVLKKVVERISQQLTMFPGYAKIPRVSVVSDQWTVDNGFITPTLKIKRNNILEHYQPVINEMYKGH